MKKDECCYCRFYTIKTNFCFGEIEYCLKHFCNISCVKFCNSMEEK